ncbi:thioredoxin family protein [Microbacterium pumilum]
MRVEILHISECPSWIETARRVRQALDELGLDPVNVEIRLLQSRADASAETSFAGSPTILIDGSDAFPGATHSTELACRVYPTPAGLAGSPTQTQITDALRSRIPDEASRPPQTRTTGARTK